MSGRVVSLNASLTQLSKGANGVSSPKSIASDDLLRQPSLIQSFDTSNSKNQLPSETVESQHQPQIQTAALGMKHKVCKLLFQHKNKPHKEAQHQQEYTMSGSVTTTGLSSVQLLTVERQRVIPILTDNPHEMALFSPENSVNCFDGRVSINDIVSSARASSGSSIRANSSSRSR